MYKQVECIFDLVRDNKFFAELDAEMSLELCRHMTYTTLKRDRVVFYKGDPGEPPLTLSPLSYIPFFSPSDQDPQLGPLRQYENSTAAVVACKELEPCI